MSKDTVIELRQPPKFKQPIQFEHVHGPRRSLPHPCFFEIVGWRSPRQGEWFLSGAIIQAYRASRDFPETSEYWIVRPTYLAVKGWRRGERVEIKPT